MQADICVTAPERNRRAIDQFLARWADGFKEVVKEYKYPCWAKEPECVFDSVDALINKMLESPGKESYGLDWWNPDPKREVRIARVSFGRDDSLHFGLRILKKVRSPEEGREVITGYLLRLAESTGAKYGLPTDVIPSGIVESTRFGMLPSLHEGKLARTSEELPRRENELYFWKDVPEIRNALPYARELLGDGTGRCFRLYVQPAFGEDFAVTLLIPGDGAASIEVFDLPASEPREVEGVTRFYPVVPSRGVLLSRQLHNWENLVERLEAFRVWELGDCQTNTRDGWMYTHVAVRPGKEYGFIAETPEHHEDPVYMQIAQFYARDILHGICDFRYGLTEYLAGWQPKKKRQFWKR